MQHAAVGEQHERQLGLAVGRGQQPPAVVVALDVEPPVRHLVSGQEVAGVVRLARPPVPDHLDAVGVVRCVRPPRVEEVVDDRVELLVRRVPGLQQVVVERDAVDRVDRRLGVGVGGEEHALGLGGEPHRLLQELDARHLRHALVGEQQRDRIAAQLQSIEQLEPLLARGRAKHAILLAVLLREVAIDREKNVHTKGDGDQHQDEAGRMNRPVNPAPRFEPIGFHRRIPILANRREGKVKRG